jgi:hypothetical protein
MLNLIATLVVSALPASPAGFSACPDLTPAAEVGAGVGECEQAAPLDLWYRMSRFAETDPGSAGAAPPRRPQVSRTLAACDGPRTPAHVSAPDLPPVALVALPGLLPLHVPPHFDGDARALPARAIAPPERPPRA